MKEYTVRRYDDYGVLISTVLALSTEHALRLVRAADESMGYVMYGYRIV